MHNTPVVMTTPDPMLTELAARWDLAVVSEVPDGLYLTMSEGVLGLRDGNDEAQRLPVTVDFLSAQIQYRKSFGGGRGEPIVKAIGMKGSTDYQVIDATPGLGRDAFVLASAGCRVTLIERSAVVAALLDDGLRRLSETDPSLASRFRLMHGNSTEVMQYWDDHEVDAVYLDPMFPHRKKSALVKKEMRLFQHLLGDDPDADALLAPARKLARKRVVVKRPNAAQPLAQSKPTMAITSKKHRFDVYVSHNA